MAARRANGHIVVIDNNCRQLHLLIKSTIQLSAAADDVINFLEQLAAEWYEFRGYFVRRNVRVGPRPKGGRTDLGGGKILMIADFMKTIRDEIRTRRVESAAVQEQYQLLRALQFAARYWSDTPRF